MPRIFIAETPPGIGNSTSGIDFILGNFTNLDPDQIAQRYRKQVFKDYKDIGNLRFNDLAKKYYLRVGILVFKATTILLNR